MLRKLRQRLTYANVMSTLAVFIALGGSSYAAYTISGSSIKNRSISAKKLKRNTLGGREIKESRLARVPRARNADRLGGLPAANFKIRCPSDTFPTADVCVERTPRAGQLLWQRRAPMRPDRHTRRAGPAPTDPRRATGGAHGGAACSRRGADLQRLPVERRPRATRRPLHHRSGGQRRPHTRHGCGSQGVSLRHRPTQLRKRPTGGSIP